MPQDILSINGRFLVGSWDTKAEIEAAKAI
jgi:hypothetical protein